MVVLPRILYFLGRPLFLFTCVNVEGGVIVLVCVNSGFTVNVSIGVSDINGFDDAVGVDVSAKKAYSDCYHIN